MIMLTGGDHYLTIAFIWTYQTRYQTDKPQP